MHAVLIATLSDWLGPVEPHALFRLLVAALLGAGVGWERERHGRAAGLRTHLLLCLGCALIMLVSLHVPTLFLQHTAEGIVRADPGRMAAQALSGLGFLGAGAIIVLGGHIRGLTTAACIWATAGIGMAVGAGYMAPAVFAWALVVIALLVLGRMEQRVARRDQYVTLELLFERPGRRLGGVREFLEGVGFEVLDATASREGPASTYSLTLRHGTTKDFEAISNGLMESFAAEGIQRVVWD